MKIQSFSLPVQLRNLRFCGNRLPFLCLLLVPAFLLLLLSAAPARADLSSAGIDLGAADRNDTRNWAVFTLGSGNVIDSLSGNVSIGGINGTMADFGAAGAGKLNLSGNTNLNGTLYQHTSGSLNTSGNTKISGGIRRDNASNVQLAKGAQDAITASNKAYALPATAGYPTTINTNQSMNLSGSGNVVLKLTDFVLSGGATLNLQGTAQTAYIINVSKNFSISSGNVALSGGLTWDNVLFNVRGTGTVNLSGNTNLNGTILATSRVFNASGNTSITGQVIADRVNLSGNFNLKRPPRLTTPSN